MGSALAESPTVHVECSLKIQKANMLGTLIHGGTFAGYCCGRSFLTNHLPFRSGKKEIIMDYKRLNWKFHEQKDGET